MKRTEPTAWVYATAGRWPGARVRGLRTGAQTVTGNTVCHHFSAAWALGNRASSAPTPLQPASSYACQTYNPL